METEVSPPSNREAATVVSSVAVVSHDATRFSAERMTVVESIQRQTFPASANDASESEPERKRSRVEGIALPTASSALSLDRCGSGPQTPITPSGPVRIKSIQRPSSASEGTRARQRPLPPVPSPGGAASLCIEPVTGVLRNSSFGSAPGLSSPSHPASTPTSVPLRSPSSSSSLTGAAPSAPSVTNSQPLRHSADTLRQWSDVLVRSMLVHWPRDMEASVQAVMLRVVAALPLNPATASDRVRCLASAFRDKKNERLRDEVMGDVVEVERLVSMTERELMNPERLAQMQEASDLRARNKDWSELRKAAQTHSDLWQCPRCGGRDSMWDQKQTRSGDEPMTTLIWCNKCGFHWRKRG